MTEEPSDVTIDVAELAKKSSVAWIRAGARTFPVWHEWVESAGEGAPAGAICVVGSPDAGGSEQPLPPLGDGDSAVVLLRSKTDRQLAAAVPVVASVVQPGSELWEPVTGALKAGRLNAPDMSTMIDRWARECRVLRLVPSGPPIPAVESADPHSRTSPRLS
ncbi:MAG TPA: hypothetical protein VJ782_10290 [Aeromicrobium sp.]|nr:hypothetical protein [Aeromicrobium sp.]